MVNKCCAPDCRSGYKIAKGTINPEVSFHRLPKNTKLRDKWKRAIPRQNWNPTSNSVICSLHFEDTDYVRETQDHNTTKARAKRESGLKLRILTKEALERGPIRFPNCPSYMSSQKKCEASSDRPTSSARFSCEIVQMEGKAESFMDQDRIKSIQVSDISMTYQSSDCFTMHRTSNNEALRLRCGLSVVVLGIDPLSWSVRIRLRHLG